jgi:hypothetical protein
MEMTQDEIIEMAREVQKDCVVSEDGYRIWSYESLGRLIKLAAAKEREACADAALKAVESSIVLAMKIEREACAKVCDELAEHLRMHKDFDGAQIAASLSFDIRARGQA